MSAELIERYETEVARLEQLIAADQRDRKRMVQSLWGLLLCPFGFFFHKLAPLGVAFVVLSLFGCGLYLSSMHFWDRTEQLRLARRTLAKLREESAVS